MSGEPTAIIYAGLLSEDTSGEPLCIATGGLLVPASLVAIVKQVIEIMAHRRARIEFDAC